MKKIFICILLLVLGIGTFVVWQRRPSQSQVLQTSNIKPPQTSPTVAAGNDLPTTPQLLSIPKLNINTTIESVGLDSKGNMDVPKNADNVAWYNKGFEIGDKGSAVIAGHFDKISGDPAVFYKLSTLKKGDTIIVTLSNGKTLSYEVAKTQTYPHDEFPLQEVFNTSDQARLNLITCEGTWNKNESSYSNRLVVYTVLKE